jgi:hypothetical protein
MTRIEMSSDPNWRSSGPNAPLVELLNKEGCCADALADQQQALQQSFARISFCRRRGHCLVDQSADFQPGAFWPGSYALWVRSLKTGFSREGRELLQISTSSIVCKYRGFMEPGSFVQPRWCVRCQASASVRGHA